MSGVYSKGKKGGTASIEKEQSIRCYQAYSDDRHVKGPFLKRISHGEHIEARQAAAVSLRRDERLSLSCKPLGSGRSVCAPPISPKNKAERILITATCVIVKQYWDAVPVRESADTLITVTSVDNQSIQQQRIRLLCYSCKD